MTPLSPSSEQALLSMLAQARDRSQSVLQPVLVTVITKCGDLIFKMPNEQEARMWYSRYQNISSPANLVRLE